MKLLMIGESPLERVGTDYYAREPWVRIPQHMAARCERVTVWAPTIVRAPGQSPSPEYWRIEPSGLHINENDNYSSFRGYYRLWPRRVWAWRRAADRLLREHDAVLIRVPSPMLPLVVGRATRQQRPVILFIVGDSATQSDQLIARRGLARLAYGLLVRAVLRQELQAGRRAAAVYAWSSEIAQRHRRYHDTVTVMQDPHLSLKDFVHRTDTCQDAEVRLLRLCWLIPSKGLEYLLEAVALLQARGIQARLEVVGKEREPGYLAALEQRARDLGVGERVRFEPWVPFDRLGEVYARNDIQVVSSLAEGTPRCVIEGFARGLPLVCTAVGGCADTLLHERDALLVPPRDAGALAGAVERMVHDGSLRRRLIQEGYQRARSVTFEQVGVRLLAEIEAAVARKGPAR